jgi:hypothetical protein
LNITRGLLRASVMIILAWIGYRVWVSDLLPDLVRLYLGSAAEMAAAVFAAGLATAWVIRGFRMDYSATDDSA